MYHTGADQLSSLSSPILDHKILWTRFSFSIQPQTVLKHPHVTKLHREKQENKEGSSNLNQEEPISKDRMLLKHAVIELQNTIKKTKRHPQFSHISNINHAYTSAYSPSFSFVTRACWHYSFTTALAGKAPQQPNSLVPPSPHVTHLWRLLAHPTIHPHHQFLLCTQWQLRSLKQHDWHHY